MMVVNFLFNFHLIIHAGASQRRPEFSLSFDSNSTMKATASGFVRLKAAAITIQASFVWPPRSSFKKSKATSPLVFQLPPCACQLFILCPSLFVIQEIFCLLPPCSN